MKLEQWTLTLAAAGVVGLASMSNAEEALTPLLTAVSSTTISGYVDTSAQWNPGRGDVNLPTYLFGGSSKADGFNLDVVQLRIEKSMAEDTDAWATGYRVDLWLGPDANALNTQSISSGLARADFAIRQAYVALRTPVGNGIDWKVGVFDSVLGYESVDASVDPNYTRSYGRSIEPQTHTGILGRYQINDCLSMQAGIADTFGPTINERAQGPNLSQFSPSGGITKAESYKTYMAAVEWVAPTSMGFLADSRFYAGFVNGFSSAAATLTNPNTGLSGNGDVTSWYLGATVKTPVTGLLLGAAWDYLAIYGDSVPGQTWSFAGYTSYQVPNTKLSLHGRIEYFKDSAGLFDTTVTDANGTAISIRQPSQTLAMTATVQYDLWKNVLSRLEVRWDHALSGQDVWGGTVPDASTMPNGTSGTLRNEWLLAANIIYKF
jgi:Putative beta-barrel porin-2, OmpL-like. bbp2